MKKNKFIKLYFYILDNIISLYLNNPITKSIKLYKINRALTIVDISNVKKLNIEHFMEKDKVFINNEKEEMNKYLLNFLNIMNKNFDKKDLKNLYDNIVWVMFKKFNSIKYDGDYDPIENLIRYSNKTNSTAIYHELFHLASNPYNNRNSKGGFEYNFDNIQFGYGLTEGYTELLNKRYFNSKTEYVYRKEILICKCIEDIIGKEKMSSFYLNADLFHFIKELNNVYTKYEIERFICSVDFIHDYGYKYSLADCEIATLYSQEENVIMFLLKGYLNNLINTNYSNEIIEEKIYIYIKELIKTFEFDIDQYFISEINNIIYKILNKNINLNINLFKERKNML